MPAHKPLAGQGSGESRASPGPRPQAPGPCRSAGDAINPPRSLQAFPWQGPGPGQGLGKACLPVPRNPLPIREYYEYWPAQLKFFQNAKGWRSLPPFRTAGLRTGREGPCRPGPCSLGHSTPRAESRARTATLGPGHRNNRNLPRPASPAPGPDSYLSPRGAHRGQSGQRGRSAQTG